MKLLLVRFMSDDEGTLGTLFAGDVFVCFVGELPWRDNKASLSCIPAGLYKVDYMAASASGKYKDVYHVQNVKGRSGILIHPGNYTGDTTKGLKSDSWGCLLPGSRVGKLSGQRAVLASRGALSKIHAATDRKSFELEIRNA